MKCLENEVLDAVLNEVLDVLYITLYIYIVVLNGLFVVVNELSEKSEYWGDFSYIFIYFL